MLQRILIIICLVFPFQLMAQDFQIIATNTNPIVGETIILRHENDINCDWTMSDPSAFVNNTGTLISISEIELLCVKAGQFNISATDGTNEDTITIFVQPELNIPTVFTPNNDGKNDNFIIPSPDGTLMSITIFSRWGNIVYQTEQPTEIINWNGRLRDNSYVSSGVYYYVLEPKDNPAMEKKMGFVHVYTNKNK
ncbi:MAG: hypothetical protein C0599_16080 [Salinivirgaceae bacterium]|nr:MAG: hypothetical protein C0599_16080 [Salinivirgaceae bacterium]